MGTALPDLNLKCAYDSGEDDIAENFYIPVLSVACSYDRIAGFFSSSSLALAARGLGDFIKNGGVMRLVTCPRFTKQDAEMLQAVVSNVDDVLAKQFVDDYERIEDQFERDHVQALGWMLANGKLQMKIAILCRNGQYCTEEEFSEAGIMHQKVGLIADLEGNELSFSGSNNESLSGWYGNTEEFKVFMSWKGLDVFIESDRKKFDGFWNGTRKDVIVKDLPTVVKEKIISVSKSFELEEFLAKVHSNRSKQVKKKETLKLFPYQSEAVEMWERNNRQLILEMATGTGKTLTALGCVKKAVKDTDQLLIIVATPQVTLSSQWEKDINRFDIGIENVMRTYGGVQDWEGKLQKGIKALGAKATRHLMVFTTHDIVCSNKFTSIINEANSKITRFLVGDEVHGLGAPKTKNALLDCYRYRLGLSATPDRWFDDGGTTIIKNYFGNNSFVFSIEDALKEINPFTSKPFLVNYEYHPCFLTLNAEELEEYLRLTNKIKKLSWSDKDEIRSRIENLRFQRADIEKRAKAKTTMLNSILDSIGPGIKDTIIFVSAGKTDEVVQLLGKRGIRAHEYVMQNGTVPSKQFGGLSEREYIIEHFKRGNFQVLVAVKCLDEGIDIPSAKRAIIMASSTNPREYIQRIGRIIRQAPGKDRAELYDMIVRPTFNQDYSDDLKELEKQIFDIEMRRVIDLSRNSINNITVCDRVYKIKEAVANG